MGLRRRLIGPGIVLLLAVVLGAGVGGWLAARTDDAGSSPTVGGGGVGALTPLPRPAPGAAFEVVSGPEMATRTTAAAQATETATGERTSRSVWATDHAGVCVHEASGKNLRADELAERVTASIHEAYRLDGRPMLRGYVTPRIGVPCPIDPPVFGNGVTVNQFGSLIGGRSSNVEYHSGFRSFIYLLPDATIQREFRSSHVVARRVRWEGQWMGHVGFVFSSAHFLTVDEFRRPEYLGEVLRYSLALPEPPSGPLIHATFTPVPAATSPVP